MTFGFSSSGALAQGVVAGLGGLLEQLGEGREPGSEGVEGFLQGLVAAVGVESVEPFGRGIDAEEHEAGQQSVFRISYQRFHLLRRA